METEAGLKNESATDELARKGMLQGDEVGKSLAERFQMGIIDAVHERNLPKEFYEKIPYAFLKKHFILPYKRDKGRVFVAVSDPMLIEPLEELRMMIGETLKAVYCPKEAINFAIHECYNQEAGAASKLLADLKTDADEANRDGEAEAYDLLDRRHAQAPLIKLLNLILTEAIQQGASDIHFDPAEDGLKVRYRIDGVLQARHFSAPEYQTQLLTRIKVMSKLDIAEHRLPQDGRIKLKMGPKEIDFRVSTVPVVNGERIVLRILDRGNVILGLDNIGMHKSTYEGFKELTRFPEGIVLVTGPTGSGKTTTLYSAICELASDEINVMTIEDPVEYNLKGIAQIGVRHKIDLSFSKGLRHILRQDPDVIMIGEIRDLETAEIAIQASLTGHLVLSTLHTNDAPSAITRLVDMGIEPYLLSSSIIGVMAQRLVRKICPFCKVEYKADDAELASIGIKRDELENPFFYKGKGCDQCYGSGFKGRHGIYELMKISHAIHKQIVTSPDALELKRIALEEGMITLLKHGSELVKKGITTSAEVLRATRGAES